MTITSWLEANGKVLVCLDPMLDLSTPAGRAFASITATFAQFERETIAARVREARHRLRESGKYTGGQVPFGYRPVPLDMGWGYEPDPVDKPVVAEMYRRYTEAESMGNIARWLNANGVPTPADATRKRNAEKPREGRTPKPLKGTIWRVSSVRKILTSMSALGASGRRHPRDRR